jgi:hypothetical protein
VPVGAPQRHGREVGGGVGVRVAVAVVGPDRRDRDGGADSVEEAVGVGRRSVMWDLEHIGAQQVGAGEQAALGGLVGVAG